MWERSCGPVFRSAISRALAVASSRASGGTASSSVVITRALRASMRPVESASQTCGTSCSAHASHTFASPTARVVARRAATSSPT